MNIKPLFIYQIGTNYILLKAKITDISSCGLMHILIGDSNPIKKWMKKKNGVRCSVGFTCADLKQKRKCNAKWKNVGLSDRCLRFLTNHLQHLRIKNLCRRTCASCTPGEQKIAPVHEDDTNELGDKPAEIIGNARYKDTLDDSILY